MKTYHRYVAIGDSTTEGLDDPDGVGSYRGWANRFAELVAAAQPDELLYANLAVRGLKTREIRDGQLERALSMSPDLCTVVSGTNDVLRSSFDANVYGRDVEFMQRTLIEQGATVLTFTLPDLSSVNPIARLATARIFQMNAKLRAISASTGAIVIDLAKYDVAADRRLWSRDRLHANALGHSRIAEALADAISLPGSSDAWKHPMEGNNALTTAERVRDEAHWLRNYLWPWIVRRLRGQSSGDGVVCKRPELLPVRPPA